MHKLYNRFHPCIYWIVLSCVVIIISDNYKAAFGCLEDEKIALIKLNEIIPFNEWGNKEADCCSWYGVTCNEVSKRIITIDLQLSEMTFNVSLIEHHYDHLNASLFQPFEELQNLILQGGDNFFLQGVKGPLKLPKLQVLDLSNFNLISLPLMGELPSLKFLYLSYNGVHHDFKELTNSSNLELLNLGNNTIEGEIPPSILALTSLKMLGLSSNYLNGSLPEGLCAMTNLEELDLSGNGFEGVIPTCLSNLTSLQLLDLSHNRFSGSIPSNLFSSLKSLELVSLSYNQFAGFFSFSSFADNSKLKVFELESYDPKFKVETENAQWIPSFFQLQVLRLSNCILNGPVGTIPSFLLSQYDLRIVDLSHNGMTGELPSWLLTNNSKLEYLSLRNNHFSGQFILQLVAYHAYMSWLDISMNQVAGEIPVFIGSILPNLTYLNMSTNAIDGSIPTSIENMIKLRVLDLSNNHLSGEFIGNFFNGWEELAILKLSNNNLGGNLTNFLSNILPLETLMALYLDNNNFYGDLETVRLTQVSFLVLLDISNNLITGRFPDWISELVQLETLVLSKNHLQGKLPTSFCKIGSIQVLDLSWNNFSDTFPSCSNQPMLNILHLQGNGFHGPLPTSLSWSAMVTLDVRDNKFSGLIPAWIGLMPELKFLLLKGNLFHGSIPSEICQIENLRILDFAANNLSGTIPPCLSNISFGKTKVLDYVIDVANQGDIMSSIPATHMYSYESQLQVRKDFSEDYYEDYDASNVPEELQFITKSVYESYTGDILYSMVGIDLSLNRLTGPIHFGNWDNVRSLNISYNHFNGSIPTTLSSLINLESLDLSHNMLSGEIPSQITELNFLQVFSVAYNNLSGPTPTRGQFATFEATSYEGNPLLCGPLLDRSCSGGPTNMSHAKPFDEPEQNDSSYKTTFLWSFFGSFVVTCIGTFVFIYFGTDVPQKFLILIRVEEKVTRRRIVELPWKWNNK